MNFKLEIKSNQKIDFVDITEKINQIISETKVEDGLCNIFVKHTTAAIIVAEAESDLLSDMEKLINLIPKTGYSHGHGDPGHTPAHILSSALGQSMTLPVISGQLNLGTWQSVLLLDLHGPRTREISISISEF